MEISFIINYEIIYRSKSVENQIKLGNELQTTYVPKMGQGSSDLDKIELPAQNMTQHLSVSFSVVPNSHLLG